MSSRTRARRMRGSIEKQFVWADVMGSVEACVLTVTSAKLSHRTRNRPRFPSRMVGIFVEAAVPEASSITLLFKHWGICEFLPWGPKADSVSIGGRRFRSCDARTGSAGTGSILTPRYFSNKIGARTIGSGGVLDSCSHVPQHNLCAGKPPHRSNPGQLRSARPSTALRALWIAAA